MSDEQPSLAERLVHAARTEQIEEMITCMLVHTLCEPGYLDGIVAAAVAEVVDELAKAYENLRTDVGAAEAAELRSLADDIRNLS